MLDQLLDYLSDAELWRLRKELKHQLEQATPYIVDEMLEEVDSELSRRDDST